MDKKPVMLLMGPTASGKSAIAFQYATLRKEIEIVSVDSVAVYKGLDIGSAKPSVDEQSRVPHHMLDLVDPDQQFSSGAFLRQLNLVLNAVHDRGHIPLLVGGTILYFNLFLNGLSEFPHASEAIRKGLTARLREHGLDGLYQELLRVDPYRAFAIHPNDAQRTLRALEIFYASGEPMSKFLKEKPKNPLAENYALISVGLTQPSRESLSSAIKQRLQRMLAQGWLEEVTALLSRWGAENPALKTIGYRQMVDHLQNKYSLAYALDAIHKVTLALSKRQETWLRSWKKPIFRLEVPSDPELLGPLFLRYKALMDSHL